MSRASRSAVLLLAVATLGFLETSCGTDHSQVRFVHASVDAAPQDVAADGKTVATGLAYGNVSPASDYVVLSAGTRRIEVRDTGTTTDLINSTIAFASQKKYTLLIVGLANSVPPTIAALLKTDDNSAPPSGNIKLRLIHAASGPTAGDPPLVDVYIVTPGTDITNVTPTISSLAYQQASDYQNLAAATYEVIVTDSTDASKFRWSDQTYPLTAGQIRTLITLHSSVPNNMSLLELSDLN
ncbi:MAG: DUF4397 domain-containing protein [Acidobacteria bacterium]|nr:DUF4397 domain-containing protein [Acidobacteriota bacterium]